jgi:hypothetical protein
MRPHRSTPPPTRANLQTLLDRGRTAWRPSEGESWGAFVRRKAPPEPSFFHPIDRGRHRQALGAAIDAGETRRTAPALLLPVWLGNNEDEEPRDDVWQRILLLEGHTDSLHEVELTAGDPTFWARVELTVVGGSLVGLSRQYAPGIDVRRFEPFAVVATVTRTVVEQVHACELVTPTLAPTRVVPAFSALLEPAFDTTLVPAEVAAAVHAAVSRLQFANEDEDETAAEGELR